MLPASSIVLVSFFHFTVIHCVLMLAQVTTLNVAFNSQNKSLVAVFISNNVSSLCVCAKQFVAPFSECYSRNNVWY